MGQNFLTTPRIATAILDGLALNERDSVLEIGSGLGALTIPLAHRVDHVYAMEPDRQIVGLLKNELLAQGLTNVRIMEEDILTYDISRLAETVGRPLKVVGNLPYHISSQVTVHLVTHRQSISSAVLMYQKELAERLLAQPGSKAYGRLSVLLRYCSTSRPVLNVPAAAFFPKPGVDSAVIAIDFLDRLPFSADDEPRFFTLVQAAFGKRRKMLRNALTPETLGLDHARVQKAFQSAGIDDRRRGETLSLEEFVRLSNALTPI